MNFIISQIFGVLSTIAAVASVQFKNIKMILLCLVICNGFGALSYVLLGGFSGCGLYIVAVLQSIIYFVLRSKEIKAPSWLTLVFLALFALCTATTYKSSIDMLSGTAALICALAIVQEKPSVLRILSFFNGAIWMIYDIYIGAYMMLISHIFTAASSMIGIIRYDIKRK